MLADWISEMRPRTLLLGFTNCALGCALGFYYGDVSCYTLLTALCVVLTGVMLQILCNFANDYGDAYRQADGSNRKGPIRAVMVGAISLTQLRKGMAVVTIIAAICGALAVFLAVGNNLQVLSWFIFLGVISILAALFYTIGMAYGYKGFGDIAVFIFFGLVAVIGSQILITAASENGLDMYPDTFLLGVSSGLGSVMVLHVASTRDIIEDRANGKHTLASRLGFKMSAVYLLILLVCTICSSVAACIFSHKAWELTVIVFGLIPLCASAFRTVRHIQDPQKVARELKFTALGCAIHHISWMIVLTLDFWAYA